jgi:plasmid stabilization system protein ParE
MTRKIVWDNKAKQSFLQIIKYLKSRSPQSAQKVEDTILKRIETTVNNPEYFRPDKYKGRILVAILEHLKFLVLGFLTFLMTISF